MGGTHISQTQDLLADDAAASGGDEKGARPWRKIGIFARLPKNGIGIGVRLEARQADWVHA